MRSNDEGKEFCLGNMEIENPKSHAVNAVKILFHLSPLTPLTPLTSHLSPLTPLTLSPSHPLKVYVIMIIMKIIYQITEVWNKSNILLLQQLSGWSAEQVVVKVGMK